MNLNQLFKMDSEVSPSHHETAQSNAPLCAVCKGFGDRDPDGDMFRRHNGMDGDDWIYVHHPNLVTLQDSADTGCRMCQLLLDCLKGKRGYETAFSEAHKLESCRREALPSGSAFNSREDTEEAARVAKLVLHQTGFDIPGIGWQANIEDEWGGYDRRRILRLVEQGDGYDEELWQTNFLGRIVIVTTFLPRYYRSYEDFPRIFEVRVLGLSLARPYESDFEGLYGMLEGLISVG